MRKCCRATRAGIDGRARSGTSLTSWEEAARNAVETAGSSLRDLRVAEISRLDMRVDGGKVVEFRARVSLSFKNEVSGMH
ncbi:dodecin family protein [Paraburkholderia hiiakae]|uniref:dodecin family protein n=1 Tax=Paraburkholderia hiiakae TaxID=1081782 RepID=UPI001F490C10|nr:dodecin family protein [Paraburkholderia hiiakae]